MTRKSEGATAGLRRGRTLATAGLGAATLIGGLVYAMPANAAGSVTASLTPASSTVINDGSSSDALTIKVNNGTATALSTDVGYRFVLSVPNDSTCAGVSLTADAGDATAPVITKTAGACQWTTATTQSVPASGSASDIYDLKVVSGSGATGAINVAATVVQAGAGDLATASTSLQLTGPTAAAFNTVPNATIKQTYSQQLYSLPSGGTTPASVTVYAPTTYTDTTGTHTCYTAETADGNGNFQLNGNLMLDHTTGKVEPLNSTTGLPSATAPAYGPNGGTDSNPTPFIVVVNNNIGGASATAVSAGTVCPDPTKGDFTSAVPVVQHDVSASVAVPVVFKDVPLNGTFAKAIYTLGDAGTSTGYADGSYQPTNPISRQAMASMLDSLNASNPDSASNGGLTTCGTSDSAYSDVPYTSEFCAAIVNTSNDGLFNGYTGGTFHPTANISRQAISAVLFREYTLFRLGNTNGDAACSTPVPFNDVSAQSPFCGDIEWMKNNSISTGYNDGGYHPTAASSRQAIAQFLYKLNALENPTP